MRKRRAQCRREEIAIETRDEVVADALRTNGGALELIRATAEAGLVHRRDHAEHAPVLLGLALRKDVQLRRLRGDEEHRGGVLAGGAH